MSTFKNWLQGTKKNLSDQVKKFKNKDFMDAVVAGCAVVAAADGSIDAAEKQKMGERLPTAWFTEDMHP